MDFLPLILYPCYRSHGYSLSHPHLYFRWPTEGTTTTTTTGTTTEIKTCMSTRSHPLRLLLSKCWICKHKCFKLCNRPWSTCRLLNLKHRHRRQGIGLGIFSALSRLPFSHAVEPMDADDWLKSIEKKLQVMQCNNRDKVLLASHQLSGPADNWWDAYVEAHEEPVGINWPEFSVAFRAHHVSQGVINLKKKEFQDLK
jgi:hypothetical protein